MSNGTDMSKVDEMIAAAKSRMSARMGGPGEKPKGSKVILKEGETLANAKGTGGRARLSDEERAARKEKLEAERAERKAARELKTAAAKAEREAEKANHKPHMKKIETAASRLPALDETAQLILNEATASLSAAQLVALSAHIDLHNRIQATTRAVTQKLEIGDQVRVVSGNARYLGRIGTISEAKRIRCFVDIEGVERPVYLFTSDVELVSVADEENVSDEATEEVAVEATGTDG